MNACDIKNLMNPYNLDETLLQTFIRLDNL